MICRRVLFTALATRSKEKQGKLTVLYIRINRFIGEDTETCRMMSLQEDDERGNEECCLLVKVSFRGEVMRKCVSVEL